MKNFQVKIVDAKLYERKVSDIDFEGAYVKVYGWGMLKNNADKMLAMNEHNYSQYGFKLIKK